MDQDPNIGGAAAALIILASTVAAAVGTAVVATIKAMDAIDARAERKKKERRFAADRKRFAAS